MALQIQHLLIVFTGKFTSFDNVGIATQQLTVTDLRNLTIEILNLSVNYIFSTNPMSVLFTYTVTDAAAHSNSCTLQVNLNPAGTVADTTPPHITGCTMIFSFIVSLYHHYLIVNKTLVLRYTKRLLCPVIVNWLQLPLLLL